MFKKLLLFSTLIFIYSASAIAQAPYLVKNINPTNSSYPMDLIDVNGTLFFIAEGIVNHSELWKSDGTTAGTVLVKDFYFGGAGSIISPNSFTVLNGILFFVASDGTTGQELWKSDGTAAGTVMVKDIYAGATGSNPTDFFNFNGALIFNATTAANGTELWKSDGTTAGTVLIKDVNPGSSSGGGYVFTELNGILYFSSINFLLYKTDGTTAGTVPVNTTPLSGPFEMTTMNGYLYYRAYADPQFHYGLWKSDGTSSGTVLLKIFSVEGPKNLVVFNNSLLFWADDGIGTGMELWKSDGTISGTTFLKDLVPGAVGSYYYYYQKFALGNGFLFFYVDDNTGYHTPWRTDGTANGTYILKSVGQYTFCSSVVVNGMVFFNTGDNDPTNGPEMYKTDGTVAGTVVVYPDPGSPGYHPTNLKVSNAKLFFSRWQGGGNSDVELYAMNAPSVGVDFINSESKDLSIYPNPTNGKITIEIANHNDVNAIIYTVLGEEIFKSDIANKYTEIDLSNQPKGVYLLKTINQSGVTSTRQIILN